MLNLICRNIVILFGALGLTFSLIPALECSESNCKYFRIGVGGAYHSLNAKDSSANINSAGGYLALSTRGVLNNRFASEIGGRIGLGNAKSKGEYFKQDTYAQNTLSIFNDFYLKLGLNIATANIPLFVNIAYGWDSFSTNTKEKGIGFSRYFTGGEIDGFIPISNAQKLEYLLGYYYLLSGDYVLADSNTNNSKFQGNNYMLKASIAYAGAITT